MEQGKLSPGATDFFKKVLRQKEIWGHEQLGINHAILTVLEQWPGLASSVVSGLDVSWAVKTIQEELEKGSIGKHVSEECLLEEASKWAAGRGSEKVFERDIVAAVFAMAGYHIYENLGLTEPSKTAASSEPPAAESLHPGEPKTSPTWAPRAKHPTPLLEQLARDLTREAAQGKLFPVLGRKKEISDVMVTLLRERKSSPLLVGPAGVGKTAIVEGLAQAVVQGDVPDSLKNVRIFALQVTDLVQGMRFVGDLEQRMKQLLQEASQDGVIVFIDEIHAAIGAGAGQGHNDVANILKPALGRGEICCIGATTREEYERYIRTDSAFERRFVVIPVGELGPADTLNILRNMAQAALKRYQIKVTDKAIECVLCLSEVYMRNRYRPDRAIDVMDQALAQARLLGAREVTEVIVNDVVSRMVGMPLGKEELEQRLQALKRNLVQEIGCDESVASRIVNRLSVTVPGMDMARHRPNAVLLVPAAKQASANALARVISSTLFGEESKVIEIDMSGWVHPSNVNWLTGAPPGYVGHDEALPFLMDLSQRPWCVVHFVRPDLAHPQVQTALGSALRCGYLRDARGRSVYLSEAIVLLSVGVGAGTEGKRVGFQPAGECPKATVAGDDYAKELVVREIAENVDTVVWLLRPPPVNRDWVQRSVLEAYSKRWAESGYPLVLWDDSLLQWILEKASKEGLDRDGLFGLVERELIPNLVAALARLPAGANMVTAKFEGQNFVLESNETSGILLPD